jgi:hypothetical protein
MSRRIIIGVMGSGDDARKIDCDMAFELGACIAREGWVVLSGGRNKGIMDAVSKGANSAGGLTLGIIPYGNTDLASEWVDIPIVTNMGSARNNINVLSSDVVVACGNISSGTLSEIALAIKAKKPTILLGADTDAVHFLSGIGGDLVMSASSSEETVQKITEVLASAARP